MIRVTLWFGVVLTLFGLASYLITGASSLTALIPAFVGVPIALLGIAARDEQRRTMALGAAAVLGLLGLLGTLGGLTGVISSLLLDGKVIPSLSLQLQALMAVICAVFVGLYARDRMSAKY